MLNPTLTKNITAIFASQKHPFHILGPSPLPFLTGIFLFFFLVPLTFYMHGLPFIGFARSDAMHFSFLGLYVTVMCWFITILQESRYGFHTRKVQNGLRLGMILFIVSEVIFFFAFFWAFFHYSLIPSVAIGNVWPPFGTQELNAWGLPFVNTLLLLASGVTITIAHAYIVKNHHRGFSFYLFLTILLGVTFLFCQGYEYKYGVKFSWRDNIYGSIFFITTGFHGLHVTIGTLFLLFCWLRHYVANILFEKFRSRHQGAIITWLFKVDNEHNLDAHVVINKLHAYGFTPRHHFGFEAAAWYWHFVDVVWLFLFITIYWWGGK